MQGLGRYAFILMILLLPHAGQAKDLAVVSPVASCASLTGTDLTAIGGEGSAVTAAEETTSDGIPVCSVTGTLAPEVTFQVLLPMETWSQRYLQIGCGGLCGNINLASGASAGCKVLNDGGFVMAATDMGHSGNDGTWGLDPAKRADFAYRAQHITGQAAAALIAAYYGQDAAYRYFNGCSDGGREALMAAMRFPDDYDGVIAGAPAMLFQVQNTLYHGWMAVSNTDAAGETILTSDRLPIVHRGVIAACDASDGVTDGLIAQPALCEFDPASLTCAKGADTSQCLTAAETEVVRKFHDGPHDAATGAALTAGQPLYGSELNWQGVYVADSHDQPVFSKMIVDPVLRYLAFDPGNPDMTLADLQFTTVTLDALRPRHPLFDATNPDLSGFQAAGGKLIMWHGLADPHISPANTVALQDAMIAQMGAEAVSGFERLYLFPGMAHCGGGQGPSHIDLLSAMLAWVEDGQAPDAIMTATSAETSSFGQPDLGDGAAPSGRPAPLALDVTPLPEMTRPAYPYPHIAAYSGTGAVTDGASWTEGPAAPIVALKDWPGADLFTPYAFMQ